MFLYHAARMLGPPKLDRATPPSQVKRTPVGPVAMVLIIAISIGAMLLGTTHHTVMLLVPLVIAAIIFGSVIIGAAAGYTPTPKLDDYPVGPTPEDHIETTRRMEARATQLRGENIDQLRQLQAERPLIEMKQRNRPPITTLAKEREREKQQDIRLRRVAAILVAPCPECEAPEAGFCTFVQDASVYLLDRDRAIVAHAKRIGYSMKRGWATIEDVKAQFNGTLPDDVTEAAL